MKKTGVVLALLLTTTSAYAYNEMNAKGDCIHAVERGGQYHKPSNKHAKSQGHKSYKVTGDIRSRHDNSTHRFSCNIKHGRVVNWHVANHASGGSHNNNGASVGAGIIAIAAMAALANSGDKHATHTNRYNDYDTAGNAFDDMRYLKKQCRQNLRHHINRAHGRVSKIKFDTAHLHRRSLSGRGYVVFERGGERDMDYNCEYDYRGNIRDGHYNFGRY